ncbi:hypothetical protein BB559_005959 [Furculomyces boomerangus]|uniref:Tudor domain-containing protein n=1 Tax=Furculomyces boomerangus TaxID=61424 RepID=A0A2T9Y5K6_9FUNG|nr:hypothetical protein BB559_005959 [Furculomyces boomerangus]
MAELLDLTYSLANPESSSGVSSPSKEHSATPSNESNVNDPQSVGSDTKSTANENVAQSSFWKVGDDCKAKYSRDGKFYPAKIIQIIPGNKFKVTFIGYGNSEELPLESIQTITVKKTDNYTKNKQNKRPVGGPDVLNSLPKGNTQNSTSNKKQKQGKNVSVIAQKSWLDFAKNKKKKAPAINNRSIFKSPDTVEGKVGVIGSGKTMTQFVERVKYR